MKFLSDPQLLKISTFIEGLDVGHKVLHGRLELYSCQNTKDEKRTSEVIESKLATDGLSKSKKDSTMGEMTDSSNRKVVVTLINTLNASFPDFDFCDVDSEQFSKEEDRDSVAENIQCELLSDAETVMPGFKDEFWKALNDTVKPNDSSIYSYAPAGDSQEDIFPFGSGFCYFFFNKKAKKVALLVCWWVDKLTQRMYEADEEEEGLEIEGDEGDDISFTFPSPATQAAAAVSGLTMSAPSPLILSLSGKSSDVPPLDWDILAPGKFSSLAPASSKPDASPAAATGLQSKDTTAEVIFV